MRVSDDTREKWLKAFGAELPEAIKPFAEDEQDEHVTNGGMLARPEYGPDDVPLTTAQKVLLINKRMNDRRAAKKFGRKAG